MDLVSSIIALLVGSAVFLTGMRMMSSGLKKSTGKGLKRLLKKTQNNGPACMGIGTCVTALIQSSDATSVMAIGFVGAGTMTVFQAANICLGGYLGTTVTGVLASLSSFSFSKYIVLLAFIGAVMQFFKSEKVKNIGSICAGLGLLFFGLDTMKTSLQPGELLTAIQTLFINVEFPLLLLVIGVIFTAAIQSSSATTGIVIVLLNQAAIKAESGFYIILGATIGTAIATVFATIGSNTDSKRVLFIALVDRIICALIGTSILWIVENTCNHAITEFFIQTFKTAGFGCAMFLVIYNLIFLLLAIPFVKPLEKLANKVVKDKESEKKRSAIKYINKHLLGTPYLAMMQVKLEIISMLSLAELNFKNGYYRLMEQAIDKDEELVETENKIDFINGEISNFLIALTNKVSAADEKIIGGYFHVINDIERIGDHAYNFYEMSKLMSESDLVFSDTAKQEMKEMIETIYKMFSLTQEIFANNNKAKLKELHKLENLTDKLKSTLSYAHYDRLTKNQCSNDLSPFYINLVSELERVADHLVNIGYSIDNPLGNVKGD